ncbi:hypothetical protein SEA_PHRAPPUCCINO_188 [Mycobacterium phage Phrappuccino]|uniref:Uncharacterized protein n=1 Tax=Mycobacterium phage Phrappuccino TaxID=2591223 RepID=A0A514DE21_9CAUD|nr:hypothetical protein KHQ87_gp188 [Mycobacterium phage Phrappuccino]QDH91863.1 hypothetical protein SEA_PHRAPPUCCINO_188 [Mycobacterium phage Phrappuccino]QIQ63329.1 hypothetical protein SEA_SETTECANDELA_213 [Mycobacterium phage Settecandela]
MSHRDEVASLWLRAAGEPDIHQGVVELRAAGTDRDFSLFGDDEEEQVIELTIDRERAEWLRDQLTKWLDGADLDD